MKEPLVLTRYLYIKEDVLMSLLISILEKNYDESLFWASELYFSGFEQETVEYIYAIYMNLFYSKNPKLERIMKVGLKRYDKGIYIIASLLLNLTSKARSFTLQYFISKQTQEDIIEDVKLKLEEIKKKETSIIIFSNKDKSNKYDNYIREMKPRSILRNACKYKVRREWIDVFECHYKNLSYNEIFNLHVSNWLYYASFSPIWMERIHKFKGKLNDNSNKVDFENEDYFEEFHEKYEYDIDEQPIVVQNKIFGSSILKKLNINDLFKTYEPCIKIHKIKKFKRNK